MRKAIALALAAGLSPASLGTQQPARPDFSGEWVLDVSASVRADMGARGRGPAPGATQRSLAQPRQTKNVQPRYPPAAQAAGITGSVILQAVIDTLGHVTEVRILRSVPGLDDAAAEAVSQWEYEPVRVNGVVAPISMTSSVVFSLTRRGGAAGPGPSQPSPPISIKQNDKDLEIKRRFSGGSETITYRLDGGQAKNKTTLTAPMRNGEYRFTTRWDGDRLVSTIDSFERDFSVQRIETLSLDGDVLTVKLERPDLIINGQPYTRTDLYRRQAR